MLKYIFCLCFNLFIEYTVGVWCSKHENNVTITYSRVSGKGPFQLKKLENGIAALLDTFEIKCCKRNKN